MFPSPCEVLGIESVELHDEQEQLIGFPSPCRVLGIEPLETHYASVLVEVSVPLRGIRN